ncbi:MAG: H-NS family nucleoid-associated regulatory protein [Qingshengfaniella sp.]
MADFNVDKMPLSELKDLKKAVSKAIETYEDRQRQEARAAVEAKAREMGFSLNDLVQPTRKSAKRVNPPKYRHPDAPDLTWSGRGRQPAWIKDILSNGGNLTEYLI